MSIPWAMVNDHFIALCSAVSVLLYVVLLVTARISSNSRLIRLIAPLRSRCRFDHAWYEPTHQRVGMRRRDWKLFWWMVGLVVVGVVLALVAGGR